MGLKQNYFFSKTIALFLLPAAVLLISCAADKNSAQIIVRSKTVSAEDKKIDTDFSGIYRLSDTLICDIVIKINKKGNDYTYIIKGTGFESSGKLSYETQDEETYINFSGTLCSGDKTPVNGLYSDKKIIIQNYGNSMNQYVCLKSCDSKYLEFVKSE